MFIRLAVSLAKNKPTNNEQQQKHVKTGWGQIDPDKVKQGHGWNRSKLMDGIKHERFRGDLNSDWNFPKGTYFEYHQWGKNLYEDEKVNKKKNKKCRNKS